MYIRVGKTNTAETVLTIANYAEEPATLVMLAYTYPCANRWPVKVAEHVPSIQEQDDNVTPTDTSKIDHQQYSKVLCWLELKLAALMLTDYR